MEHETGGMADAETPSGSVARLANADTQSVFDDGVATGAVAMESQDLDGFSQSQLAVSQLSERGAQCPMFDY